MGRVEIYKDWFLWRFGIQSAGLEKAKLTEVRFQGCEKQMYVYQKRWALITDTHWLQRHWESTTHTYPILLFGTSKRRHGFETSRMHKGWTALVTQNAPLSLGKVGMSAVTVVGLVSGRSCPGGSGIDNLPGEVEQKRCLKQTRTMGLVSGPVGGATFNPYAPWLFWQRLEFST